MRKCFSGKLHLAVVVLFMISISACAGNVSQTGSDAENYPVEWTDEFSMPDLVEGASSPGDREDLRNLLGRRWYTSIDVITDSAKAPVPVGSCKDYFSVEAQDLRADKGQEKNALLELIVMCEATRLLADASAARQSNIPARPLNEDLSESLPEEFALITSQNETRRIMNDPAISSWGDVNDITEVIHVSEHRAEYHSVSGVQTLSILGRGDFNDDGREDILVSVQDSLEGGSYFNRRLFVISVNASGSWDIEYQHRAR